MPLNMFLGRLKLDWSSFQENSIDFYFGQLVKLGCWSRNSRDVARPRLLIPAILSRCVLLATSVFALLVGPVSIYTFLDKPVMMQMEATLSMFMMGLFGTSIVTFLYQHGRLEDIRTTCNRLQRISRLYFENPPGIGDQVKTLSKAIFFNWFWILIVMVFPIFGIAVPAYTLATKRLFFSFWVPAAMSSSPWFELYAILLTVTIVHGGATTITAISLTMTLLVQAVGHLETLNYNLARVCQQRRGNNTNRLQREETQDLDELSYYRPAIQGVGETSWEVADVGSRWSHADIQLRAIRRREEMDMEIKLGICVNYHQTIIRHVTNIVAVFEMILVALLTCSVVPFISGLIVITTTAEFEDIFVIGSLMFMALSILCMLSYLADNITQQSGLIREAVFGCDWLRASDGFKRSLRIIMSRSNQPTVIKVAGFIPLNMETFFNILKLTYSYYMSFTTTMDVGQEVNVEL